MSVARLIEREFGGRLIVHEKIVSVTVTPVEVVSMNPDRLALLIQNIGVNNVYISTKPNVAVGEGLLLLANGGTIAYHWREDGYAPLYQWFAIATGDSKLYVQEYVLIKY